MGISGLLDEIRPLLNELRNDVTTGTKLANNAQDQANSAQDEADQAAQVPKNTQRSPVLVSNGLVSKPTCVCRTWRP